MDKLNLVLQKMPLGLYAFFFLIVFLLFYIYLYIYISMNIKNICKIIFNDENKYKIPLEPFDFLFISFIPTTFWRELLNLKIGINFQNLYKKDFYFKISKNQLIYLLKRFPTFFILQYISLFLGILFMILMLASYYLEL
jgi:hypothetical protein